MRTAIVLPLLWFSPLFCWHLELAGQWLTKYDSNIAYLPTPELADFQTSYRTAERLKLVTYDDWINGGILKLRLKGRPISATLTLKRYFYLKNPIKNYTVFSLWFSGRITRKTSLSALYSYIPSYHSRSYYDEDSSAYLWCDYAVNRLKLEGRGKIANGYILKLGVRYSLYYYNSAFLEYDSKRPQVLVSLARESKAFSAELGLTYGARIARGYDSEEETKSNSNENDLSYKELKASFTLSRWIKGFRFSALVSYQSLIYTTEKYDPLYRERVDRAIGWRISIALPSFRGFNLLVGITGERRYADSPHLERPNRRDYSKLTSYMLLQVASR